MIVDLINDRKYNLKEKYFGALKYLNQCQHKEQLLLKAQTCCPTRSINVAKVNNICEPQILKGVDMIITEIFLRQSDLCWNYFLFIIYALILFFVCFNIAYCMF